MTWVLSVREWEQQEHITKARPSWWEGAEGYVRQIERFFRSEIRINDVVWYRGKNPLKVEYRDGRDGIRYIVRRRDGTGRVFKVCVLGRKQVLHELAHYLCETCQDDGGGPDFLDRAEIEKCVGYSRCVKRGSVIVGQDPEPEPLPDYEPDRDTGAGIQLGLAGWHYEYVE